MRCSPCTILVLVVYLYPISRVRLCAQGRPSPLRPCCTSPLFQVSPYFRKIFRLYGKFSNFYLFPTNLSIFLRQNFSLPFFSNRPQISNFPPYLASFSTFPPPCLAKIIIFPYCEKFPPVFKKFTCFLRIFRVFRFPPTLTMMYLCITQCTYWKPWFLMHEIIIIILKFKLGHKIMQNWLLLSSECFIMYEACFWEDMLCIIIRPYLLSVNCRGLTRVSNKGRCIQHYYNIYYTSDLLHYNTEWVSCWISAVVIILRELRPTSSVPIHSHTRYTMQD